MRFIITTMLLVVLVHVAAAQQVLKGKIYDKRTDSTMSGVTVINVTRKTFGVASGQGTYSIEVAEGDKVIFTSAGYVSDTLKVENFMIDAGYDVTMEVRATMLRNVTVEGASFRKDSMERREDYAAYYNRSKNRLVSKTGPENGVGIAFSPIGFLSKRSKNKKLGDKLKYEEEQEFVDYTFNKRYVERMTQLHGDSLFHFMLKYRPSYEFCRGASSEDLLNYVNQKIIEYRHPEAEEDKKHKKKSA